MQNNYCIDMQLYTFKDNKIELFSPEDRSSSIFQYDNDARIFWKKK